MQIRDFFLSLHPPPFASDGVSTEKNFLSRKCDLFIILLRTTTKACFLCFVPSKFIWFEFYFNSHEIRWKFPSRRKRDFYFDYYFMSFMSISRGVRLSLLFISLRFVWNGHMLKCIKKPESDKVLMCSRKINLRFSFDVGWHFDGSLVASWTPIYWLGYVSIKRRSNLECVISESSRLKLCSTAITQKWISWVSMACEKG